MLLTAHCSSLIECLRSVEMPTAGQTEVAVVGAGPYGLATAAHLTAAGVSVRVFGEPMESWERNMPKGMLLRSRWDATHIADPDRLLSLDRFYEERGLERCDPIPLAHFTGYGRWYQESAVSQVERRRVEQLAWNGGTFRVGLDGGESFEARRVVVAAGIVPFAWRPPQFEGFPPELVSHTADHDLLSRFAGRRVAVVGGGQSALESAALLTESGAEVRVLVRAQAIKWLGEERPSLPPWLYAYARIGIGGAKSAWLEARPDLYRRLPRGMRESLAYRSIGPAGASWLVPRLRDVEISLGASIAAANRRNGSVRLALDDGSEVEADHVLLATGYRIDLSRYAFLERWLLEQIRTRQGSPILGTGSESSLPGLHFVGATAAETFGPVTRFVSGTWAAARAVTRSVVGRRAPRAGFSW